MAIENDWGAPRIHGELLKLGFDVDDRTVTRYMPKRTVSPDEIERWKNFLRNHLDVTAAMDFFHVPTVMFKPSPMASVVSLPRVGGIHHCYQWREAG